MQTKTTSGVVPAGSIFSGEASLMAQEVDFRIRGLTGESERERLAGPREGVRQHVGHALMALGRAIHGIEPAERAGRPALDTR